MSFRHEMIQYMAKYKNKPLLDVLNELSLMKINNNYELGKEEANTEQNEMEKTSKSISEGASANLAREQFINIKLFVPLTPPHYVKCPITKCEHLMDPCYVMAHYVMEHKNFRIQRVFDDLGEGFSIRFKPFGLEKYASHCVALLAFGGKVRKKKNSLPIVGCRQLANEGLPPHLEHLKYDLPILIMASRSIVALPLDARNGDKRFAENMVVVWPTSIELDSSAKDLYCWILGKAPAFTESHSTLVEMRSFVESEDSMNMLLLDNSTFNLKMRDVDRIILWGEVLKIDVRFKLLEFFDYKSENAVDSSDADTRSNKTFSVE